MDTTHLCRHCATDVREGTRAETALSADGITVTFTCVVPVRSQLPRMIVFVSPSAAWYRHTRMYRTDDPCLLEATHA